jgi:hypothetical protein
MESILGPLGTSATTGLLYLPRVTVMIENLVEWRVAGETEILGENLSQRHFVHHKSHLPDPGSNPAAVVGSQRLIAWAMARSCCLLKVSSTNCDMISFWLQMKKTSYVKLI